MWMTSLQTAGAGTPDEVHQMHTEVADVRVERSQYRVIRTVRSPITGEILQQIDETSELLQTPPTQWQGAGSLVSTATPDATGGTRSIFSLSLDPARAAGEQGLVLGFSLPGIHSATGGVTVADAGFGQLVPTAPLSTTLGDWTQEPAYTTAEISGHPGITLKDATGLTENLATVIQWYQDELGFSSWDGKGGIFHAAVRGDRSDGSPGARAFGGNGFLMVEGGHTSTGHAISDALDIVAHEYTHSVISGTMDLGGSNEAGALNEGLADVFGKLVEGLTPQNTVIAQSVGRPLRDILHPSSSGNPESYGEYSLTTDDKGGVHLNSTIISRALALTALGESGGLTGAGAGSGSVPLARLLLASLRYSMHANATTMEAFAAGLAQACESRSETFCSVLEKALSTTDLLSFDQAVQG
jgi:hypothetical protein